MKKVSIGAKPVRSHGPWGADQWVKSAEGAEPTKRLTIDVPLSLHTRVKSQCALERVQIANVVREFLDQRFPSAGNGEGKDADPRHDDTETRRHDES